jgi:two-component system phosphate regulon sensor histidine kinase PhoR
MLKPRLLYPILLGGVAIFSVAAVPLWRSGRALLPDAPARADFDHNFALFYLLGTALCVVGALIVSRLIARAAQRASVSAELLARGQTTLTAAISSPNLAAELASVLETIDRFSVEMRARMSALEAERNGLTAILGAMEEGLVVVDSRKLVLMANASARRIMGLPETELQGRPLQELTRQQEMLNNIDMAISASQTCNFEYQRAGSREHILVRCAPFRDGPKALYGAVVVLHDISELRRLERVRTEFVANVSHELRTPLTSLLGYLETLQDGAWMDRDQAQEFLQVCRRQAERLSRIVEDLLRLSRLENPQQEMAAAEINLEEVVGLAVEQSRALAGPRGITVELDLPGRAAAVWGDRGLLVQAVSNLVENAINYNRDNGKVIVKLGTWPPRQPGAPAPASGEQWEIAVSDSGIGIPPEAVDRIFERFYRIDKGRSRERGGTGLGLSIVKHIALAHGASIHVESELDKGSTFRMRFKRHEKLDRTARVPAPEQVGV